MNAPQSPGFYLFRGARHVKAALYERICEPVEVREIWCGNKATLGVAMTGRQTKFRLETFEGTWQAIPTEDVP